MANEPCPVRALHAAAARPRRHLIRPFAFADYGRAYDFIWQSCSRDICEVLLTPDMETLQKLDDARQAVIGYRPSLRAEPLVFRTGRTGVVEGLCALKQARR